jgi:hypothetical protein
MCISKIFGELHGLKAQASFLSDDRGSFQLRSLHKRPTFRALAHYRDDKTARVGGRELLSISVRRVLTAEFSHSHWNRNKTHKHYTISAF